ncbi:Signal transduction protein CetB, mediates an energy taxis response [hydrothermal vent metagenome]|uniref:Signal transduction protein CetB, mediates an energy taxis response n=1 Tax=hydrothermal vent metagenome TaxID=652676 RepID=A0A1W1C1R5_9ZZZZ
MAKATPTNIEFELKERDFLVSKTDTKGVITYCNEPFMKAASAQEKELLGKPHNIVRHPEMPRAIFKLFWEKIQNGDEIFAYVKNLRFDGGFYWVYANVTASFDERNNIIGYYSVRRKVNPKALDIIKPIYERMISIERSSSMSESRKYLDDLLKEKGVSYEEFSNNLQRL